MPDGLYFEPMWNFVEILLEQLFEALNIDFYEEKKLFEECLPIVTALPFEKLPGLLSVIILNKSHSRISNGTGRFFADAINRFGLPGHHLNIQTAFSVDFCFEEYPDRKYGLSHIGVMVSTPEEWTALQKNLPKVMEEIRVTVRAVYLARKIVSLKELNTEEKNVLMREKFISFWERGAREFELNLFDQIHQWIIKAQAENNSVQLWKEILPFIGDEKQISFDRDMFLEIQTLLFAYCDDFIAKRKTSDLAKLLCYQYFFKKKLQNDLEKESYKRHIYVKVYKLGQAACGISIGVNLLNRYELLDANHILAAIQAFDPELRLLPHSYIVDARQETMRFYYLEVYREGTPLSDHVYQLLKKNLAQELGDRIESVNHPLFLPFNEEALLKYVTILSKELNKEDIPQVVISFDRQSQDVFSFHLIVLRYVTAHSASICSQLQAVCPSYRWVEEQVKRMSLSKAVRGKEASIIKVLMPKLAFFRKDFSLDLGKARKAISAILTEAIGEYRDYNGGTTEVQQDAFHVFKEGFPESEELLLERFFYGIEPAFMQMVIHPILLKEGYTLCKRVLRQEFDAIKTAFLHCAIKQGAVAAIASPFITSSDTVFQKVVALSHSFPSSALCTLWVEKIYVCVLLYSCPDPIKQQEFLKAIQKLEKME
jgi:hypothetical protein